MKQRNITLGLAIGLSVLMTGCASTPPQNAKVDEARASYDRVKNDPAVARSGDTQLRSARDQLDRAESLLKDSADNGLIEHAAYMAHRHAQIASQQGERAELQTQIESAEERRRELMLAEQTGDADSARREAEALRQRMAELQAEQTDRGMVLTLGDVLFDLDQADLKSAGEQTVARLAEFMREYEDRRVRVEGYTDSTGADSYNQQLSERRAESVRNALINQGTASQRVEVKGYGEQYPVAGNDSSSGRQQNRRVEIVISDKDGNIETR
ncbi:outer membrane protein OmpA-like peptidoglycan-associated protein [Marinobacter sp. LV10R520-4]|uniref:OmpA family protein n=1 Tax=Marinobacter sp. LV10R520-4 TaxID=1761796 RepID=UPI000BF7A976|nr:OmpA family protein [Marinobacter sp. LV10R520-4]PFG53489.1 outer membrane protein OmpA-like peptidoglycan-associated protein [Marinobacter sp. LV10R520-4]